jgi:hypothetical protein
MIVLDTDVLAGVVSAQPLHTFNTKHYQAVPGLQTVQPYTRPT